MELGPPCTMVTRGGFSPLKFLGCKNIPCISKPSLLFQATVLGSPLYLDRRSGETSVIFFHSLISLSERAKDHTSGGEECDSFISTPKFLCLFRVNRAHHRWDTMDSSNQSLRLLPSRDSANRHALPFS